MVFHSTSSSKPPVPYQELLNHSVVRKDSKCSQAIHTRLEDLSVVLLKEGLEVTS